MSPILLELLDRASFADVGTHAHPPIRSDRHPLDGHRREYRYLLHDLTKQEPALKAWATHTNRYQVHTVYLDTPRGTWTRGKSQVKFRLRHYNDESEWWIELKTNVTGMVDKTRRKITLDEMDGLGLQAVSAVTYNRQEFEADPTNPDLRVTVDDHLLAWQVPNVVPLSKLVQSHGVPVARLKRLVLETKSHGALPMWLNLPERWDGSKSRWSVAAVAGHPDTVGPSLTNEQMGVAA